MKRNIWPLLIFFATVLMSIVSYAGLPDTIAVHFGPTGEPDKFSSKLSALITIPAIMLLMIMLFGYRGRLMANDNAFARSQRALQVIQTTVMLIFSVIQGLTIAYGYGFQINMATAGTLLMGTIFVAIGNYLPLLPQNHTTGIRTPWTYGSETVWRKTHHFCSRLFVITGLAMLVLTFVLPANKLFIVGVAAILIILAGCLISSYYFFKKNKK